MNQPYPNQLLTPHVIRAPSVKLPYVIAFVAGVISLSFDAYWLSALGVSAFVYYLVRLLQETGVDLPIESFMLVMASLQWIIGPALTYAGLSNHYKFHMYVPEEQYMSLAVPSVIMFSIGLYSFRSRKRIALISRYASITRQIVTRAEVLPYYLIGIGFVFSLLVDRFPPALAFPAYILSNIKYIGLIYLIFSDRQHNKIPILIIAFVLTFISSLKGAMFHDLILWSAFVGMYAAYILRPTTPQKAVVVGLGLVFIFVIQVAKEEYRAKLEAEGRSGYVGKFITAVDERFEADERLEGDNTEKIVIRINQGWIISNIMRRVPSLVPHADGETVIVAIKASILPRLLFPDKPIAGGRKNYEKYTDFYLQRSTSMGISLLGEAYINFGVTGAWAFMFVFGFVSSYIIRKFFLLAARYPTIWLWFPLILLHFVKAETELLVQLNFLVKSIIMVYAFVWANKYFLKLKL